MLFLTCPSDLQCIGPTTAVKTTCLKVGWAVEGMGVGPKIHHPYKDMSSSASEPRLGLENKCLDSSSNIMMYDTIVGLMNE